MDWRSSELITIVLRSWRSSWRRGEGYAQTCLMMLWPFSFSFPFPIETAAIAPPFPSYVLWIVYWFPKSRRWRVRWRPSLCDSRRRRRERAMVENAEIFGRCRFLEREEVGDSTSWRSGSWNWDWLRWNQIHRLDWERRESTPILQLMISRNLGAEEEKKVGSRLDLDDCQ